MLPPHAALDPRRNIARWLDEGLSVRAVGVGVVVVRFVSLVIQEDKPAG